MHGRWIRAAQVARRFFSVEKNQGLPSKISNGKDTLGRRLLSLIFPKRSAVVVLRKWMEEGKPLRKYELNRVVREIRKHKRYKHALEICEWMITQPNIKLLPGDYAVHLDLIGKVRGLTSAEKFFDDLPEKMIRQPTCTSLLHCYVQHRSSFKAEALMKKMAECGFLTCALPFNHMLSLYISTGQLDKIPELIQGLKRYTSPDTITYNLWLTAYVNNDDIKGAETIFHEIEKSSVRPDWMTYSLLTSLYTKASILDKATQAVKEMEKLVSRNSRIGYTSLITLHTNLQNRDDVRRIWKNMKSLFQKMNDNEYVCFLSFLVKLGDMEETENVYREWESVTGTHDPRPMNILLSAYIKNGYMDKAKEFHEYAIGRGIKECYSTWEILARGYLNAKKMDRVLDCLEKGMSCLTEWKPNDELVSAIFGGLQSVGDAEGAEKFLGILRNTGYVTTSIYNGLLRTYEKAGRMPLIIAERMKKDKVQPDDETHQLIRSTSKLCVGEVTWLR